MSTSYYAPKLPLINIGIEFDRKAPYAVTVWGSTKDDDTFVRVNLRNAGLLPGLLLALCDDESPALLKKHGKLWVFSKHFGPSRTVVSEAGEHFYIHEIIQNHNGPIEHVTS